MIIKLCEVVIDFPFPWLYLWQLFFLSTTILGVYILSRVVKKKEKQLKQIPQKLNNLEKFSIDYSLVTNNQGWEWGDGILQWESGGQGLK